MACAQWKWHTLFCRKSTKTWALFEFMLFKKYIYPVWYAVSDYVTTALAWAIFYIIRKLLLHEYITVSGVFTDEKFWLGVFLIPIGWLSLYTLTGSYLAIYKKSRLE